MLRRKKKEEHEIQTRTKCAEHKIKRPLMSCRVKNRRVTVNLDFP